VVVEEKRELCKIHCLEGCDWWFDSGRGGWATKVKFFVFLFESVIIILLFFSVYILAL